MWSTNDWMTNVFNMHTWSIGRIDLIIAIIRLPYDKLIKLSCNMICCTRICIPIWVNHIGVGRVFWLFFPYVCWIKPLVALKRRVICSSTQLAWWKTILVLGEITSTSATRIVSTSRIPATTTTRETTPASRDWICRWVHLSTRLGGKLLLMCSVLDLQTVLKSKKLRV
jgi:hypothetical protein